MTAPPLAHARARARRLAMQALYQWDLSGSGLHEIRGQFLDSEEMAHADRDYFTELFNQTTKHVEELDESIAIYTDRPVVQLDPVERAILRIGTFELMFRPEIPFRVVINEAVQLAKKFGATDGHRYVNGVLDRSAHTLRAIEYGKTGTRTRSP